MLVADLAQRDRGDLGDLVDHAPGVGRVGEPVADPRARSSAAATRSRMMSSCRKFSPTNSSSPLPSSSLRFGISAVCGIGMPERVLEERGHREPVGDRADHRRLGAGVDEAPEAVLAERGDVHDGGEARSSATATVRIRRSPRRRASSAAGSGVMSGDRGRSRWRRAAAIAPMPTRRRARMPRMSRTVITFGTFDVFHVGHLRVIERAAALGDRLVVGRVGRRAQPAQEGPRAGLQRGASGSRSWPPCGSSTRSSSRRASSSSATTSSSTAPTCW